MCSWPSRPSRRRSSGILGRIATVIGNGPAERAGGIDIRIGEAARIDKPQVWKHWRNPVRYMSLAELGIELEGLDFQPVAAVMQPPSN